MSEGQVVCRCPPREALWSYCPDDFFCPRCGEAVTRLVSKNRFPPDSAGGEIWIYEQKGKDAENPVYAFPLAVTHSDATRAVRRRKPVIDFQKSKVEANNHFGTTLVPVDSNSPEGGLLNRPYRVQLIPLGKEQLPTGGVRLHVPRLEGNFSDKEHLVLRVGNKPSIRVELSGRGIEQSKDGGNLVRLTHNGDLDVILTIHAEKAPILISKPLNNENLHCTVEVGDFPAVTGTVSLRLARELAAGEEIVPDKPWETKATLYASALAIPRQKVTISLNFDVLVASIDQTQLSLTLERVEKGGVEFDPPGPFAIDAMYLGECRSNALNNKKENPEDPGRPGYQPVIRRLSIRNLGRERIVLGTVTVRSEQSFDWLGVGWATDVSDGAVAPIHERLELEPHERGEIHLQVDLRHVSVEQLPRDRSLSAVVQVRQAATDEIFEIRVVIHEVHERLPCPSPVCIDFGNTSSFASIKWYAGFPGHWAPEQGIADVHELRLPESFHTVLFFRDAARDPFESDCEIGDLAIAEAEKFAATGGNEGLVSDLKRWIGFPDHTKSVTDPRGNTQRYRVADLIVLFLVRLIERAELILRKYTIHEICVSHPSKFDARRRRAFFSLIDSVCERVSAGRRSLPLKRVAADVDEANAVAVGAVLEPEIRRDFLKELVQSHRKSFVIACVDLGGGSLDTAVMRFGIGGSLVAPRFTSEYLGIGGHSSFGGDNVTLAFLECLLLRIGHCLEQNGLAAEYLDCVPSPAEKDSCEPAFKRRNYQLLWEVAEKVKLHQCRHLQPVEENSPELVGLQAYVQTRLVNDLILMPRVVGRIQSDPAVAAAMKTLVDDRAFLVPLTEVYEHQVQQDLSRGQRSFSPYSVSKCITDALAELEHLSEHHSATVDVIVLAGAGCRLPLVSELVNEKFKSARKIQNPLRTKFRVAHGLVQFLAARAGGHDFACSSHYSTFAYELGLPDNIGILLPAVPNCTPLQKTDQWHRVRIPKEWSMGDDGGDGDAGIQDIITRDGSRRVHVFRVEEDQQRSIHGWFDLTLPPFQATAPGTTVLTDGELESPGSTIDVRLVNSETDMELRLNLSSDDQRVWKLVPATGETGP
jgi:hypothetical protein